MHFILLALGLVGAAAGAGLIATNLPIDQVATGRVLVIAGVIAIAAGAILASLAVVNRRLRELKELFETPAPAPLPEEPEMKDAAPPEAPPVVGAAPPAAETPPVVEPKPAVEAPAAVAAPPKPEVPPPLSTAPLAPASNLGDVRPGAAPPASKPTAAPEKTVSTRPQPEAPKPPPPLAAAEPLLPSSVPLPPEPKVPDFDTVWANAAKAAKAAREVPPPPEREAPPPPRASAPPPPKAPVDEPARWAERDPRDGETVKIFKSGVIDGMAYALYTDGSIEAELPEGVVRFATVEDLRVYLDGAG